MDAIILWAIARTTQAMLQNPSLASGTWADLGTGSGALAIATARQLGSAGRVGVWRLHLVCIHWQPLEVGLLTPWHHRFWQWISVRKPQHGHV